MAETPVPTHQTSKATTHRRLAAWLAGAVAVVLLLALGRQLAGLLPEFTRWIDGLGPWGPAVFIAGYAVATVALVPGSILTLAAGALFGLAGGTAIVFAGATLGAWAAFLVGRHVARRAVEQRLRGNPRFAAVDRAVGRHGLRIVTLLRLSPIFPFSVLNYALSVTGVRLRDYLLANVGMLPATFLYVYYGRAIGSLAEVVSGAEVQRGAAYWALLALGLVATIVATTLVTRIARQALAREVDSA